jgi:hypothetical protein
LQLKNKSVTKTNIMHWHVSLSALSLAAGAVAKHYAIMDNDWYTAGFVPYLIALDGDIDVLGLASGKHFHFQSKH